jgi:DNA-binding XRE family transcriptional regulator
MVTVAAGCVVGHLGNFPLAFRFPLWQPDEMGSTPLLPLTNYRKREGLTKADLARRLEKPKSIVHRWESGARKIGVDELPNVVAKTGIPARELRPDLVEQTDTLQKIFSEAS